MLIAVYYTLHRAYVSQRTHHTCARVVTTIEALRVTSSVQPWNFSY